MRLRHQIEYLALLGFATLARVLPRAVALELGAAVGRVGWLLRIRRRLVLANLAQALPELGEGERRRIAATAARNFGRTAVDFVRFARGDRHRVLEIVELHGLSVLRAATAAGRGALVVTAHLGSWALYVPALAAAGIPSALLVGKQHNEKVDRFILGIPGDAVRFISKGRSAPREVLRSLKEGRAVVMVADQNSGPDGTFAPFLGRVASTLPLPGAIAARHGTPICMMIGRRVGPGRHRVDLSPLPVPEGSTALEVTSTFNAELGRAIRAFPEHYFWYHRRWRDYPGAVGGDSGQGGVEVQSAAAWHPGG
jgi:KDO2-lipid IV(A) lauroyltransferase